MPANFNNRLREKLKNKSYRVAYVAEQIRTGIAYQIRAMREQRSGMSQAQLGKLMDKPQSVVSRLEDPDYGKVTIQTLLEVAAAMDVALLVRFVSFPEFLRRTTDASPKALEVEGYSERQLSPQPALPSNAIASVNLIQMRTIKDIPVTGTTSGGPIYLTGKEQSGPISISKGQLGVGINV